MLGMDMPNIPATPGPFTLASDFNRTAHHSVSRLRRHLPFIAHVTPQAALAAVTSTAAMSVPRTDGVKHGVLEPGAAGSLNVCRWNLGKGGASVLAMIRFNGRSSMAT